jgi:hypothetical protein
MGKLANDNGADRREAWLLFPGSVAYVRHGGLGLTLPCYAVGLQRRESGSTHRDSISESAYLAFRRDCLCFTH